MQKPTTSPIVGRVFRPLVSCPDCTRQSCRIYSHCERRLADLPWNAENVSDFQMAALLEDRWVVGLVHITSEAHRAGQLATAARGRRKAGRRSRLVLKGDVRGKSTTAVFLQRGSIESASLETKIKNQSEASNSSIECVAVQLFGPGSAGISKVAFAGRPQLVPRSSCACPGWDKS